MNFKYMNIAFNEAEKAYKKGEIPIGAVIVCNDKIIAKAYNTKEKSQCCIAHAEILAIKKASRKLKNWRLENCDIYITLEPCPMCASAIKQARISNVYAALSNSNKNNLLIINKIFESDTTNPGVNFRNDLCCEKSEILLRKFFSNKRK